MVDGLCYVTYGGNPDVLVASEEAYAQLMREQGKLYLAGMSSYYGATNSTYSYLSAWEMLLPGLRGDHRGAGTLTSDPAWLCRAEPAGDGAGQQVPVAPAVEPSEQDLCP